PTTNQELTTSRQLVVDSDNDQTADAVPDTARALASAVRKALPESIGRQIVTSALVRQCAPLVDAGVSAHVLGRATQARSWMGAGPGAVMAWLASDVARELQAAADAAA